LIALGTLVAFDEIAYIVRKKKGWFIPQKGNFEVPSFIEDDDGNISQMGNPARWLHEVTSDTNKGVIAFPTSGSCIIIGLETKMFGRSTGPSGGGGLYGADDWEPGYFEPRGKINLYIGRSELQGKAFYIPTDKVTVLKGR
jgi:hypothetical protein